MSSMIRSIKRQMTRDNGRAAVAASRIKCPKCGRKMVRKGLSFKKVYCVGCGFQGAVK